jgi:hypothetical protein
MITTYEQELILKLGSSGVFVNVECHKTPHTSQVWIDTELSRWMKKSLNMRVKMILIISKVIVQNWVNTDWKIMVHWDSPWR